MMLTGAILVTLLALLTESLLGWLERTITPPGTQSA
jgi:ABC-type proline/glycine betaine transport system permease subunit